MPFRFLSPLVATLLLLVAHTASAAKAVDDAVVAKLTASLNNESMGLSVASVEASEIPGMYQVQFENGPLVYATKDGQYFLTGDLFQVNNGQFVNLAEQRRDGERVEKLAALDEKDMIIFEPEGDVRAEITVFTDVSCFYCQKLHKEVPTLNERGIRVRYLAYPRSGLNSPGYQQLVGAWCSENPQETLTKMKNKQTVASKQCKDNPVEDQYQLGQQLGVRGTPAMVTEQGQMIPGYQSADQLMATLGLE